MAGWMQHDPRAGQTSLVPTHAPKSATRARGSCCRGSMRLVSSRGRCGRQAAAWPPARRRRHSPPRGPRPEREEEEGAPPPLQWCSPGPPQLLQPLLQCGQRPRRRHWSPPVMLAELGFCPPTKVSCRAAAWVRERPPGSIRSRSRHRCLHSQPRCCLPPPVGDPPRMLSCRRAAA